MSFLSPAQISVIGPADLRLRKFSVQLLLHFRFVALPNRNVVLQVNKILLKILKLLYESQKQLFDPAAFADQMI